MSRPALEDHEIGDYTCFVQAVDGFTPVFRMHAKSVNDAMSKWLFGEGMDGDNTPQVGDTVAVMPPCGADEMPHLFVLEIVTDWRPA